MATALDLLRFSAKQAVAGTQSAIEEQQAQLEHVYEVLVLRNTAVDSAFDSPFGWSRAPREAGSQSSLPSGGYERVTQPPSRAYKAAPSLFPQGWAVAPARSRVRLPEEPMPVPQPRPFWAALLGGCGARAPKGAQQVVFPTEPVVANDVEVEFNMATAPDDVRRELAGLNTPVPYRTIGERLDAPLDVPEDLQYHRIPEHFPAARIPSGGDDQHQPSAGGVELGDLVDDLGGVASAVARTAAGVAQKHTAGPHARKLVRVGDMAWHSRFAEPDQAVATNKYLAELRGQILDEAEEPDHGSSKSVDIDELGREWIRVR